jgi:fatty-acyl-CoA synthase
MSGHRVAVVFEGRELTFEEVRARSGRVGMVLDGLGVGRGDRVAYLGVNHPAFLETLFGAGGLGAIFVPLNFRLAAPELGYILGDCGASVLVYGEGQADTVGRIENLTVPHVIPLAEFERRVEAAAEEPRDVEVGGDEIAMIMYTSGTTGRPKGVALSHAALAWNSLEVLIDVDLAGDEVTLVSGPMFHVGALNQTVLPTFLKGGKAILMPAFSPEAALDLIERYRVTYMFGVPAMFQAISASPRFGTADLSSVRSLICGGAPVPEALITKYQARGLRFLQGYGLTESGPSALFLRQHDGGDRVGSAGKPCFFIDLEVVDAGGTPVAPGEPGEIVVRSPHTMAGYWNKPAETAEVLSADGWLRTGDIAVVDEDGFLAIRDRVKDMIISGGENIYPAEVEDVLYGHPAVAECAVIGVPDEKWGEVGRAIIVLRAGTTAEPADILRFLTGKIANYKIPKSVVYATSLPRTASGKLVKSQLRSRYGEVADSEAGAAVPW